MNFIFRTDLQTLEEFVFGVKGWKARWELYPTDQINPINLCVTLELVIKNVYLNNYCILKCLPTNATLQPQLNDLSVF
jgi:hypothetical protein